MAFTAYSDFGKSINDLFSKKFFKAGGGFELNSKRVTPDVTVESSVSVVPDLKTGVATPNSGFKLNYKYPKTGEYDLDADITGKLKATATFDRLAPNLTLKVTAQTAENDRDLLALTRGEVAKDAAKYEKRPFATVQADYATKAFNLSANVNANLNGAFVDVGAATGYENLSFGAGTRLALAKKDTVTGADAAVLQDYTFGARYSGPNFVVGLAGLAKSKKFAVSHIQNVERDYTVGSKFEFTPDQPASGVLTLGSVFKPSSDTLVKMKASVAKQALSVTGYYEKGFANPKLKLGLTAEVNALENVLKPTWYGASVSVGDY